YAVLFSRQRPGRHCLDRRLCRVGMAGRLLVGSRHKWLGPGILDLDFAPYAGQRLFLCRPAAAVVCSDLTALLPAQMPWHIFAIVQAWPSPTRLSYQGCNIKTVIS